MHLCSEKKAQISCAVTAQLISAFVFANAKSKFSHDVAHLALSIPAGHLYQAISRTESVHL